MPFPRNQTKSASVVSRGVPLDRDFLRNQARPKIFECGDFPRNLPRNPEVSRGIQIRKSHLLQFVWHNCGTAEKIFWDRSLLDNQQMLAFCVSRTLQNRSKAIWLSTHLYIYRPTDLLFYL
jgi:hypothetical protein